MAKSLNAEIVSCDSRQIYKGLPALCDTPKGAWRKTNGHRLFLSKNNIPYHLVDKLEPWQRWDAHKFSKEAARTIKNVLKKKKWAIVAGGSGFYFRSIFSGLSELPKIKPGLRKKIANDLKRYGLERLISRLVKIDPQTASKIDTKNPRRVSRALELCLAIKGKLSTHLKNRNIKPACSYPYIAFYIDWPKNLLDKRIESRLRANISRMLKEMNSLKKRFNSRRMRSLPLFESIGAKALYQHSCAAMERNDALAQTLKSTKQYSKRQRTWFKKEKDLIPISIRSKALRDKSYLLKYISGSILAHVRTNGESGETLWKK
ncbi:tRNA (adenosine(37)-N6)-dimethylallyltransferase MiaA [Elusimicrobiota bacterium]